MYSISKTDFWIEPFNNLKCSPLYPIVPITKNLLLDICSSSGSIEISSGSAYMLQIYYSAKWNKRHLLIKWSTGTKRIYVFLTPPNIPLKLSSGNLGLPSTEKQDTEIGNKRHSLYQYYVIGAHRVFAYCHKQLVEIGNMRNYKYNIH